MPLSPRVTPAPLMLRLRKITAPVQGGAWEILTMTPVVFDARMLAMCPPPSIVIGLVIVTVPKPPSSRASISPPQAVFEIAPAKVLHGAVRLHGLTSSPTPDTQVRVACAWAPPDHRQASSKVADRLSRGMNLG